MTSHPVRPGFQSVVPYLSVQGAGALVDFLRKAFGAQETYRAPNGKHVEVRIGDSMVMMGEVGNDTARPGQLFMYTHDAEAAYRRAIEAGGTSFMEPCDRPWGEEDQLMRGAGVRDPSGNLWFLAGPK